MLINIHTHQTGVTPGPTIRNLFPEHELSEEESWFSLGIHPCHIKGDGSAQLDSIRLRAGAEKLIAIGECGLDKSANLSLSDQWALFSAQLKIAREYQKPVIIHCVRAWEEVMNAIRQAGLSKAVIFHGYRKQLPLAERIIGEGHYLSFGKGLDRPTVLSVLRKIPLDRIFLETDDLPCKIEDVYEQASAATGIDLNSLSLQLMKNAESVFGSQFLSL